jgi:hypothetical protein
MSAHNQFKDNRWLVNVGERKASDVVPEIRQFFKVIYREPIRDPISYSMQLSQEDTLKFVNDFKSTLNPDVHSGFTFISETAISQPYISCYNPFLKEYLKNSNPKPLTEDQLDFSKLKTREIDTLRKLNIFIDREFRRLNHWYVWNGRKKASVIKTTFAKLDDLKNGAQHSDAEIDEEKLIQLVKDKGLVDAFAMHRHTFFSHNDKAKSHNVLLDKLETKTRSDNKI